MKPTTEYNYLEAVTADVLDYIREEIDLSEWRGRADELAEQLNDDLWIADSVTGNASGSYYCNRYKAEEALCHNWAELAEALEEFGCTDVNPFDKGAEWCDVTLRCYYLGQAIAQALEEIADELEEEEEA
jgi:hypothetical protein